MRRKERQISDIKEIELIISQSDVCRIAFADNNTPYIVVMNFGYSGGAGKCLYFHCAGEGKKIDMLRKNNYVCFEMDTGHKILTGRDGCDWGMNYSSVVGFGNITVVTDEKDRITGLNYIMKHYGGDQDFNYNEKVLAVTTVLRLDIEEMTGKRK